MLSNLSEVLSRAPGESGSTVECPTGTHMPDDDWQSYSKVMDTTLVWSALERSGLGEGLS